MARDRSELSEVNVSKRRLFVAVLFGWPIAVLSAFASWTFAIGSAAAGPSYPTWIFLATAPVATCLVMARGRPTRSIAQVLHDVEFGADPEDKSAAVIHE
jgi:hypothetical protein